MLTHQVQAISSANRDVLSVAQQEAIKSVIERDPDERDPWGPDDDGDDDGDSSGSLDTSRLLYKFEPLYGYLRMSFSSRIIHKILGFQQNRHISKNVFTRVNATSELQQPRRRRRKRENSK